MNDTHTILIIAVSAAVTIILRFFPFVTFGGDRPTPGYSVSGQSAALCYNGDAGGVLPEKYNLYLRPFWHA